MILDSGICEVYRVRAGRGPASAVDGLKALYNNWYGQLRHESGGGEETGDKILRIRAHDADIAEYDIAVINNLPWRVTRVYHGTDDENGQPIADITLASGERHFQSVELIPRRVETDTLNTITGLPDIENSRSVWGSTGAVNADEYYQAETVGYELSIRVEVYAVDYNDEPYVGYNGKRYQVRRAERRGPIVNLICEAVVAWPG